MNNSLLLIIEESYLQTFLHSLSFLQVSSGTGIHSGLLGCDFRLCTGSCQGCVTPLCVFVLDRALVRSLFYSQADLSISTVSATFLQSPDMFFEVYFFLCVQADTMRHCIHIFSQYAMSAFFTFQYLCR